MHWLRSEGRSLCLLFYFKHSRNMNRLILICCCLLAGTSSLFAQPGTVLPTGEVDVIRSFEARLAEAELIAADVAPLRAHIERVRRGHGPAG